MHRRDDLVTELAVQLIAVAGSVVVMYLALRAEGVDPLGDWWAGRKYRAALAEPNRNRWEHLRQRVAAGLIGGPDDGMV